MKYIFQTVCLTWFKYIIDTHILYINSLLSSLLKCGLCDIIHDESYKIVFQVKKRMKLVSSHHLWQTDENKQNIVYSFIMQLINLLCRFVWCGFLWCNSVPSLWNCKLQVHFLEYSLSPPGIWDLAVVAVAVAWKWSETFYLIAAPSSSQGIHTPAYAHPSDGSYGFVGYLETLPPPPL